MEVRSVPVALPPSRGTVEFSRRRFHAIRDGLSIETRACPADAHWGDLCSLADGAGGCGTVVACGLPALRAGGRHHVHATGDRDCARRIGTSARAAGDRIERGPDGP